MTIYPHDTYIMEDSIKFLDAEGVVNAVMAMEPNPGPGFKQEPGAKSNISTKIEFLKNVSKMLLKASSLLSARANKLTLETQQSATGSIGSHPNSDSLNSEPVTVFLEADDVQCFEPRGRFKLKITSANLFLEGKSFNVLVPLELVSQALCLPSFASAKKEGEDLLALQLSAPVTLNTKQSSTLLLNMRRVPNKSAVRPSSGGGSSDVGADGALDESGIVVLALQDACAAAAAARAASGSAAGVLQVGRPQRSLFCSVQKQQAFVRCHRGTQEGALYLLREGVLFVKPMLLLPAAQIASLSAGRGGGSGATRYIDILIETTDDKSYEFSNIDRDELPAVQLYVKGYLEERAKAQQQAKNANKIANKNRDSSTSCDTVTIDLVGDGSEIMQSNEAPSTMNAAAAAAASNCCSSGDDDDDDDDDDDYDPDAPDSSEDEDRSDRDSDDSGSDPEPGSDAEEGDDDDGDDGDQEVIMLKIEEVTGGRHAKSRPVASALHSRGTCAATNAPTKQASKRKDVPTKLSEQTSADKQASERKGAPTKLSEQTLDKQHKQQRQHRDQGDQRQGAGAEANGEGEMIVIDVTNEASLAEQQPGGGGLGCDEAAAGNDDDASADAAATSAGRDRKRQKQEQQPDGKVGRDESTSTVMEATGTTAAAPKQVSSVSAANGETSSAANYCLGPKMVTGKENAPGNAVASEAPRPTVVKHFPLFAPRP